MRSVRQGGGSRRFRTLLHGDFKGANILHSTDEASCAAYDFQVRKPSDCTTTTGPHTGAGSSAAIQSHLVESCYLLFPMVYYRS